MASLVYCRSPPLLLLLVVVVERTSVSHCPAFSWKALVPLKVSVLALKDGVLFKAVKRRDHRAVRSLMRREMGLRWAGNRCKKVRDGLAEMADPHFYALPIYM